MSERFNIHLDAKGPNTLAVVREVKRHLRIGLMEARNKVLAGGIIAENMVAQDANIFLVQLRDEGATVRAVERDSGEELEVTRLIRGHVVAGTDTPVPDATVMLFAITSDQNLFLGRIQTDARGNFRIGLDQSSKLAGDAGPIGLFFEVLEEGQLLAGQLVDTSATTRATHGTVGDTFLPDAFGTGSVEVTLHVDLPEDQTFAEFSAVVVSKRARGGRLLFEIEALTGGVTSEQTVDVYSGETRVLAAVIANFAGAFEPDEKGAALLNDILFENFSTEAFGLQIVPAGQKPLPLHFVERVVTVKPEPEPEQEPDAEPEVERFGLLDGLWAPGHQKKLGFALQGGGLRGAFEVGALHFFAWHGVTRDIGAINAVAGASTGSLSASSLSFGREPFATQPADAIDASHRAIISYRNLVDFRDMFLPAPPTQKLMDENKIIEKLILGMAEEEALHPGLANAAAEEVFDADFAKGVWAGAATGAAVGAVGGPPLSALFAGIGAVAGAVISIKQAIEEQVDHFSQIPEIRGSLFELGPVRAQLRDQARYRAMRDRGIKLRFAVTSLDTGATCYVTEKMTLLYPRFVFSEGHSDLDFDEFTITSINLVDALDHDYDAFMTEAALTSSAFPGLFPPALIKFNKDDGTPRLEFFSDGGIRENIPIKILQDMGMDEIIALYCGPIQPAEMSKDDEQLLDSSDDFIELAPKWPAVAARAVELITAEINQDDAIVGGSVNVESLSRPNIAPQVLHIAPSVPTIGLTQIDRALFDATMAYGYMTAYDESFFAANDTDFKMRAAIRTNTTRIFLSYKAHHLAHFSLIRTAIYPLEIGLPKTGALDPAGYASFESFLETGGRADYVFLRKLALFNYHASKLELLKAMMRRGEQYPGNSRRERIFNNSVVDTWPGDAFGRDMHFCLFYARPFYEGFNIPNILWPQSFRSPNGRNDVTPILFAFQGRDYDDDNLTVPSQLSSSVPAQVNQSSIRALMSETRRLLALQTVLTDHTNRSSAIIPDRFPTS